MTTRESVILAGAACAVALTITTRAEAQPAPAQPPPEQPPIAQPQPPIVVQGGASVQQPTIIVVQPSAPAVPRKRRTLPAVDGEAPPPGYHTEERMIRPLAIAGWSTFGGGYLLTLIGGMVVAISDSLCLSACRGAFNDSFYPSLIPVAGPWIYVANGSMNGAGRFFFGFTGVLQTGGLAMAIAGMAAHTDVWVSDSAKNPYGPHLGIGLGTATLTTHF